MFCPGSNQVPQVRWQWDFVKEGIFLHCSHCSLELFYPVNRLRNDTKELAIGSKPEIGLKHLMEMVTITRWVKTPHILEKNNE